jgi:hypothetical protein
LRRVSPLWSVHLLSVSALLLALPKPAHAYVDPGGGAMLWQVAAAALIGSLFYVRRIFLWVRDHLVFQSMRATGFLFATLFALVASPVTVTLFGGHPPPRFGDLFFIGIALTAYLFTWDAAAYLAIALVVCAWVLPPTGTFVISGFTEWYRLVSFAVVSSLTVGLIARLKARNTAPAAEAIETRQFAMDRAQVGAD